MKAEVNLCSLTDRLEGILISGRHIEWKRWMLEDTVECNLPIKIGGYECKSWRQAVKSYIKDYEIDYSKMIINLDLDDDSALPDSECTIYYINSQGADQILVIALPEEEVENATNRS